jgi:hypothetical protein
LKLPRIIPGPQVTTRKTPWPTTPKSRFVVGCADLGITIAAAEKNFTEILRMSTEWDAILLLDQAGVLLERRSTHDLERNGLVSGNATYP